MRSFATAAVLAVGVLCLYILQVERTPPSLANDEVIISLTAHSIATTGKDLIGRSWPLYIQMTEGSWFHPVIVYSIALALQILPLSEWTVRLPTVIAGVTNVVLMYFIGRVLFRREAAAILAALMLALSPSHFLHSRFALEYLYPLPFICAWLLCLFTYLERHDLRWLFASTVVLGFGFYSYIASVFVMPMYMALTGLALVRHGAPLRAFGVACTGFLLPLLALFVPWFLQHNAAFGHTVGHYAIYDTRDLDPLQGLRELLSYRSIAERTTVFWGYLNPSFLFLDVTATHMYSTRTAGVFLLALAIFLPVGLYQAFRSSDAKHLLLVLGFMTAPFAAVLVGEAHAIGRALELLPFGVLLAAVGVVYLWSGPPMPLRRTVALAAGGLGLAIALGYGTWTLLRHGRISTSTPLLLVGSLALLVAGIVSDRAAWRMVTVAAIGVGAMQFQAYATDYFTDYRARASEAFLFNRGAALEYLIERSHQENIPVFYVGGLSRDVHIIEQHWRFYLIKHGREDLLSRTVLLGESTPFDVAQVPPKSAILVRLTDETIQKLASAGELRLEATIPEPAGRPVFAVYRR
jgi:4-amino-4-deoxy-L-arabinose transferase-like glycosyltransferase